MQHSVDGRGDKRGQMHPGCSNCGVVGRECSLRTSVKRILCVECGGIHCDKCQGRNPSSLAIVAHSFLSGSSSLRHDTQPQIFSSWGTFPASSTGIIPISTQSDIPTHGIPPTASNVFSPSVPHTFETSFSPPFNNPPPPYYRHFLPYPSLPLHRMPRQISTPLKPENMNLSPRSASSVDWTRRLFLPLGRFGESGVAYS